MKLKYATVLIGAFALCLSTQSNATEHHTAQALEHSAMDRMVMRTNCSSTQRKA